jgi:hypothetical protein
MTSKGLWQAATVRQRIAWGMLWVGVVNFAAGLVSVAVNLIRGHEITLVDFGTIGLVLGALIASTCCFVWWRHVRAFRSKREQEEGRGE